ncbi:EXS-domain-containing protein [Lizonia empirigonia]|nr:EXS-domain-containing protein [Lizonia empirigonia]
MDGDPAVEPVLDGFSRVLPLPYRVALIIVLGIWAWGLNLHYLTLIRIDVPSLIRYPSRSSLHHLPHHLSCYRIATFLSIPLALSLLLFWTLTSGSPADIAAWEILPNLYLLVLVVGFIAPLPFVSRAGRSRTLATLKRISIGGIAEAADGKFGDILLADALTSYAKVLGDLFISLCMFFSSSNSSTGPPNRNCGGAFWVPFVISIPSLIRLRQCITEYFRVQRSNAHTGTVSKATGWGGVHLANALKYSTAFPVIILSALQRTPQPEKYGVSEATLFKMWMVAVLVNSGYSFWWDVMRDWDLTLFSPRERNSPEHPYGLRRHRYFHAKEFYYAAIVMDGLLRCTWSLKLSPHLDHFNDLEGGIFTMEVLEVLRRWVWIFFRVETEWVRTHRGPAPDDILLGDVNLNRYDDSETDRSD